MKKSIIIALFALVALMNSAQEISMAKATADDYIKLLNNQGLYAYALDLSKLEKDKYLMAPVIQVYNNGKLEEDILSDFGAENSELLYILFLKKVWSLCGVPELTPHTETPVNKGKGGM